MVASSMGRYSGGACSTIWTVSWSGADLASAAMRIRRGGQHLRRQPAGRRAGDANGHGVSGAETEVEGQCGQERGGPSVAAEVPRLQHDMAQETKAEDRATELQAAGGKNP